MIHMLIGLALVILIGLAVSGLFWIVSMWISPSAYIYVPEGMPTAAWRYQQFRMTECDYCHRRVKLNRHHVVPWAANPALKDDPNNIRCLCRSCHQSVAHGNNWKRFNVNLIETLKTPVWVDSNEYYRQTHEGNERTEVRK